MIKLDEETRRTLRARTDVAVAHVKRYPHTAMVMSHFLAGMVVVLEQLVGSDDYDLQSYIQQQADNIGKGA